jgi:hypothetical protein
VSDGPEWFAPKRYGYGAGLPVSWKGWVVTLAYVALIVVGGLWLHDHLLQFVAIAVPVTLVFCVLCARTTRGGWRWRWGEED